MSINQPAFQLSKAIAKAALKNKNPRQQAAKGMVDAMHNLQANIGKVVDGDKLHLTSSALRDAEEALEHARSAPKTWWETIFGANRDLAGLNAKRKEALQAHKQAESAALRRSDLTGAAVKAMKIQYRGFRKSGKEFVQVQSQPVRYAEHPVITAKFPTRQNEEPAEYINKAHAFSRDFVKTMNRRSEFISPRLATSGEGWPALQRYKDALKAFSGQMLDEDNAAVGITREAVAQGLKNDGVVTKILENSKFSIKVQDHSHVGKLKAKLPQATGTSMEEHVQEGMKRALRLQEAIEKQPTGQNQQLEPIPQLSYKMLRKHFWRKRVDFKALDVFELAKHIFGTDAVKTRLAALEANGIQVKILRNKAFRITRFNEQGVVAKTRTIPFPSHASTENVQTVMLNHIENGLERADELLLTPLPKKIHTKQRLKNKLYPVKKAIQKLVD